MRIPGIRWVIACLLFVETTLAYVDLQVLSVVAPVLNEKLAITNSQYATITQTFLAAYSIMFVLGGRIIDRVGVRWGLAGALMWWSVANILHGFADSAHWLAVCRFVPGLGYPGAFLSAAKAVSEWYPTEER